MKRLQAFVSLAATLLAALAPGASPGQLAKDKQLFTEAATKSDLFAPRFRATGSVQVVELLPLPGGKPGVFEKVVRDFGPGAAAEIAAKDFVKTHGGPAPTVTKRVLKHYRCPARSDDGGGSDSDFDCLPVKIGYAQPLPIPTDPAALAACGVWVDADVLYLGRRAKTVSWAIDPPSPMVTTGGGPKPRIRLVELAYDKYGQEVRGITFSDNSDDPQERGNPAMANPRLVFDLPATSADGQSVTWTRAKDARHLLAKVYYYAVVLQLWSDSLKDYVYCEPYDPTVGNRGN